ncbi:MAG: GNAT family N-acetyltransferase [Butyricicoccus sp.]|nr:GNAT family N-acetyltransferase [Butyricicoccus sp.]
MILETERLLLRPWTQADAQELYRYASDDRVGPAAGWAVHKSAEESREIIRGVLSADGVFAIVPKELGLPVGSAGFSEKHFGNPDEPELGYWVGVPFWGRGYAPEAALHLLGHAFSGGCRRVWVSHYEGNNKSRSVIRKCGFGFEFKQEADVPALSETRVTYFYSLSREDWDSRARTEEGSP